MKNHLNMRILDIHSHRMPPEETALTDVSGRVIDGPEFIPAPGCLFSAGVHPWNSAEMPSEEIWKKLENFATLDCCAAIGECGVDLPKGGPMFLQLQIFKRQTELSEQLHLPLIIHCVKADDIICGLRRDLRPTQPWAIHGFRGKPQAAAGLLRAGCYLSFGPNFNPDTLRATDRNRILAETDDSPADIRDVIAALSEAAGEDLTDTIAMNSRNFCNFIG